MKTKANVKILTCVALAALWAPPLFAQEEVPKDKATDPADEATDQGIGEIVVTARHRSESMQKVPVAITALSAEAIETRGIRNIAEAVNIAPNVTLSTGASRSGGSSSASLFIRGVGQADFFGSFDPGVGLYVDEVFLGRSTGSVLDALDFERVEILRGPQGTLFGRNTIGGAINITSVRPTDKFEGYVRAELGTYGENNLIAMANLPVTGNLALRITASKRNRDGTVTSLSTPGLKFDNVNDFAARGIAAWTPAQNLTATFIVDVSKRRRLGQGFSLIAVRPDAANVVRFNSIVPSVVQYTGIDGLARYYPPVGNSYIADRGTTWSGTTIFGNPRGDLDTFGSSANLAWHMSDDFEIRSISAFRKTDLLSVSDTDGMPFDYNEAEFSSKQRQFSQELRLTGSMLSNKLNFVAGLFYFNEIIHEFSKSRQIYQVYRLSGQVPDSAKNAPGDFNTNSYAAYIDATLDLTDQLSLTVGGRMTADDKTVSHASAAPDSGLVLLAPTTKHVKFDDFTPKVSAQYKFSSSAMIYASYAQGYKSGGLSATIAARPADFSPFNAETQTTYEVGLKSTFFGQRVRFNLAAFRSDYKDMQLRATLPPGSSPSCTTVCSVVINGAAARLNGIEAEFTVRPVRGLEWSVGGGYLDQKFTDIAASTIASGALNFNRKLPFSPKYTLDSSVTYHTNLSDNFLLDANVTYAYRALTYMSIENDPYTTQPAYSLWNARLAVSSRDDRWELAVAVRNIADKKYFVAVNPSYLSAVGISAAAFGDPRTATVSLKYKFGSGQ